MEKVPRQQKRVARVAALFCLWYKLVVKKNHTTKVIAEYIRNQLEEDYAADQISIKEYMDPFTGRENKRA